MTDLSKQGHERELCLRYNEMGIREWGVGELENSDQDDLRPPAVSTCLTTLPDGEEQFSRCLEGQLIPKTPQAPDKIFESNPPLPPSPASHWGI